MRLLGSLVLFYLPVSLLGSLLFSPDLNGLTDVANVNGNSVGVLRPEDEIVSRDIAHRMFHFPAEIVQREYFLWSSTILVRLRDNTVWQSSDEGRNWHQIYLGIACLRFYIHPYSAARAYLITPANIIYATTDAGSSWHAYWTPTPPNTFGAQILRFHPDSDKLIWVGDRACPGQNCHAEARYTRDSERRWIFVESYVGDCAWAADLNSNADRTEIVCQSYRRKTGAQPLLADDNPFRLVKGTSYFRRKEEIFEQADGFMKLAEFLLVTQREPDGQSLGLRVSLDGEQFLKAVFPHPLTLDEQGYTFLESYTGSLFMHSATSDRPYWGSLLKSDSNGTFFSVSAEFVNGEDDGAVHFKKIVTRGLQGIALINIVANPNEALISGEKALQTRITFNDGASWRPLTPPQLDSNNNRYRACIGINCALHLHCRPRFTSPYSPSLELSHWHPDLAGVLVGIGSVGTVLAPYDSEQSATFISRDAGLTWVEVRKGSHAWAFAAGAVLVMARDDVPTDRLLLSADLGLNWIEHRFSEAGITMRVREILTADVETSNLNRRSLLLVGKVPHTYGDTVVEVDLTGLTLRQCKLDVEDPVKSDFEAWIPTDDGGQGCIFGRQTLYYRPKLNATCKDGGRFAPRITKQCECTRSSDFECDLGYMKNDTNECVRIPGVPYSFYNGSDACRAQNPEGVWSEPPAYRKTSFSSCVDGYRPALPVRHACRTPDPDQLDPEQQIGGTTWFIFFALLLLFIVGVVASACRLYARKATGSIRLLEDGPAFAGGEWSLEVPSEVPTTAAGAVPSADRPWLVIRGFRFIRSRLRWFFTRKGRIILEGDEDAQLLHFPVEGLN